jgi:N-acyl-D-amino-acid deacylase
MISRFTPDPKFEGKTISEVNVMKGRARSLDNEIATILDLMVVSRPSMIYHSMGPEDVERIMRYPFTAVASDGGIHKVGVGQPHPRSYGTNARVLAEYVRTRNILRLEDAIRRMTSLPARTFGFHDRGLIAVGRSADLVLFDPSRVRDKATFENPHQYSDGFDHVWVNGIRMVADGKIIGEKAGRVLRRGEAAARLGRAETGKTVN